MKNDELDPRLKNSFNDLKDIPPRSAQAETEGRTSFLKQAATFRQAVSRKAEQRHNIRSNTIFPPFQRKERLPVLNTLFAFALAVIAVLGGSGATVYAAQESLPDQTLYPLKIWSEDVIQSFAGSAQMRLDNALDFSDRRVAEMAGLLADGNPIPTEVETRFQNELDLALELAAGMGDTQAIQQIVHIRSRAETQLQTVTMLMSGAPESARLLLIMARARLQEQIQLAAMGEADMQGFRMQMQQRFQFQEGYGEPTPGTGGNPPGPGIMSPTDMQGPSGTGNGPGPEMNQPTEMPGMNSYGTPQAGGGSGPMH